MTYRGWADLFRLEGLDISDEVSGVKDEMGRRHVATLKVGSAALAHNLLRDAKE